MKSESLPPEKGSAAASSAGRSAGPQPESAKVSRVFPFHIPEILWEGDDSVAETSGGDAQKFSLGIEAPAEQFETEGELPKAYGTGQLLLTARDPHWLYAHWDLTREQQTRCCARAADGHLRLRVQRAEIQEPPDSVIKVQPDARHWFVHVRHAGTFYKVELGCETLSGEWISLAASKSVFTPPDRISENRTVEFATIPFETPLSSLVSLAENAALKNLSLTAALRKLRQRKHPGLRTPAFTTTLTAEQELALTQICYSSQTAAPPTCSSIISEMLQPPTETPASPGAFSSPLGGHPPEKNFWFNLNAEVIIYGATEPNALVTIGGRIIPLRPDGSFSYRFALPDGEYELPVLAIAADQSDHRAAGLKLMRATERLGEVDTHPHDPNLKPPAPENL